MCVCVYIYVCVCVFSSAPNKCNAIMRAMTARTINKLYQPLQQ